MPNNLYSSLKDLYLQNTLTYTDYEPIDTRQLNRIKQLEELYMATPEKKVKEKVKKALDDLGVYYTMPFTAGYGNSGVPDILACIEGKFFGIECKAGKNTTTALQDKHLNDIRASGGVSLVIDDSNVDNVKTLILANLGER